MVYFKEQNIFFSAHESGDLIAWTLGNTNLKSEAAVNISNCPIMTLRLYKNFLLTGNQNGEFKVFNLNANCKNEFTLNPLGNVSLSIYLFF